ncbi:2-dehydro-3-deoxygalactonokinase [Limnohabitans sp. Bal53]|uniref:2-dehydro-3-deoxygalactonokinase n=1 Tax=Limnohabitans sp. Bal53 TaxID=1977910 RepID=UPI000D3AAF9A|nr:2-dehydro-3-deoxygalactonokinase [Limnohabitans sp. Bal53]PUE41778.1 2-dehydro-3-deoxygalactonokinase [Limnohabitans sp. Bal53]
MSSTRPLITIDWGTSSLRGARLGASGQVLESREFPRGILTVPPGQFEAVFHELFGDWMQASGALCLISGMAGSRQGWQEAPYCPCPAGFTELGQHLLWLQPGRIALVPGLSCLGTDALNTPDVMRGEEVQIFGALQMAGRDNATLVLPGTHSKWVQVQGGRVTDFQTFMTGEVFALMSQQSILGKTLDLSGAFDEAAFLQGVNQSQQAGSVLHHLFAVRTLGLFERLSATQLPSYLSGLLIGEELRTQTINTDSGAVILVGSNTLTQRYSLALQHLGIACQSHGAEATWAGLFALASAC